MTSLPSIFQRRNAGKHHDAYGVRAEAQPPSDAYLSASSSRTSWSAVPMRPPIVNVPIQTSLTAPYSR